MGEQTKVIAMRRTLSYPRASRLHSSTVAKGPSSHGERGLGDRAILYHGFALEKHDGATNLQSLPETTMLQYNHDGRHLPMMSAC